MKVLLLGEYSSLHRFLKEGLQELGVEVTLVANGDGWKNISGADRYLYGTSNTKIGRSYHRIIEPYMIAKDFKGYDVVQVINTKLYSHRINKDIMRRIKLQNGLFSLAACGVDYRLCQAYKEGKFDYYLFDYEKPREYFGNTKYSQKWIENDIAIENMADIIIPSMYDYTVGYSENPSLNGVIPLPINLKGIKYEDNVVGDKVVFFHGISRPSVKGTPFIKEALEKLKEKYPSDVEVIITEKLPYDEYVKVMKKTNIAIDQCCCHSYGINACISLGQGKVVLSNNSEMNMDVLNVGSSPIISIKPDSNQIFSELCKVLDNKKQILETGRKSRIYVEDTHDHVKVAKMYIDAWKKRMNR